MSFYGSSFSFDGISCEDFGLMLYDFNNTSQGDSKFAKVKIHEDRPYQRMRSIFYGVTYDDPLEFDLIFGVNEVSANQHSPIDRQEMEVIGSWLTGHNSYKWLVIDQPDMAGIRYRCIITDLKMIEFAGDKWAFQCTAHCDSPYGYTIPMEYRYIINRTSDVILKSRSSINLPYFPNVEIVLRNSPDFSIYHKETDTTFTLEDLPQPSETVYVNVETGILTSKSGLNIYPYFNFVFPQLVRGENHLTFTGNATVTFTCEFPVNIGG